MKSIGFILISIVITINFSLAKPGIIIPFSYPTTNCQFGRTIILVDYDNDGHYDKGFIYNCYASVIKEKKVIENYNLNDTAGYYIGNLSSGSHEGDDFVYIIQETKTNTSVAKLYYIAADNILVIDPLSKSNGSSGSLVDKMDEFFSIIISKNGIINLTKKKDFLVEQIIITDINSKEVAQITYNDYSYYIDLSLYAQGIYFISIVTNEGYLKKQILLVKD